MLVSMTGDVSEELEPLESFCIACEECFVPYTNQLVLWFGLQLFSQALIV